LASFWVLKYFQYLGGRKGRKGRKDRRKEGRIDGRKER
jgi:hypothetical protein